MRLKWLKLGVAAALIGTSAHAEWKLDNPGGDAPIRAFSRSGADWFVVIRDAQAISFENVNGLGAWVILYLHPDGSVWHCNFAGVTNPYGSSCKISK
jgi:hypothetical protein